MFEVWCCGWCLEGKGKNLEERMMKKRRGEVRWMLMMKAEEGEREREQGRVWYLKLMLGGGERMEGMFGGEWERKRKGGESNMV